MKLAKSIDLIPIHQTFKADLIGISLNGSEDILACQRSIHLHSRPYYMAIPFLGIRLILLQFSNYLS